MSVLLVLALLAQGPERTPLAVGNQASSDDQRWLEEHDRAMAAANPPETLLRTPPVGWSEGATGRFVGAFLGGAFGLALPALVAGLASPPCGIGTFGCFISFGAGLSSSLAPPLSVLGATLGYTLAGGKPSAGAAAAGLLGGVTLSLMLLLFHKVSVGDGSEQPWGVVIGSGLVAVALEALALESRFEALEEAPFLDVPAGRLALESLGLFGTVLGLTLVSALVGLLGFPVGTYLAPVLVFASAGVAPLVPWAIHRAMGGEGSLASAYLGWLGSLAVAAGGIGLAVLAAVSSGPGLTGVDPRTLAMVGGGIGLAGIAAVLGTPLALEWSHGNTRLERSKLAPVKAQLSVAPAVSERGVGGGVLALTGAF